MALTQNQKRLVEEKVLLELSKETEGIFIPELCVRLAITLLDQPRAKIAADLKAYAGQRKIENDALEASHLGRQLDRLRANGAFYKGES